MTLRVGINGFGRTGRTAFRAWWMNHRDDFEIVAINRGPAKVRAHLLAYDTDYGRFPGKIEVGDGKVTAHREIEGGAKQIIFNALMATLNGFTVLVSSQVNWM